MCFVCLTDFLFVGGYRNDKGDTLAASYYHSVSPLTNTAVGAELTHSFSSNENTLTIGTQHALDPLTTVKARVNNYGKASALIQHEWRSFNSPLDCIVESELQKDSSQFKHI